jgi:TPR repeat protein
MYDKGRGVRHGCVDAFKWYSLAAEQGDADAQCNLEQMYEKGEGVPQDYVEAIKWCKLAAGQGHAGAQYNLGAAHGNGEGVPQDFAKAARLIKLAADQGNATAITTLPIILYQHLFPPGTKVKLLVSRKATMLNGLCGVVQNGATAAGGGGGGGGEQHHHSHPSASPRFPLSASAYTCQASVFVAVRSSRRRCRRCPLSCDG